MYAYVTRQWLSRVFPPIASSRSFVTGTVRLGGGDSEKGLGGHTERSRSRSVGFGSVERGMYAVVGAMRGGCGEGERARYGLAAAAATTATRIGTFFGSCRCFRPSTLCSIP